MIKHTVFVWLFFLRNLFLGIYVLINDEFPPDLTQISLGKSQSNFHLLLPSPTTISVIVMHQYILYIAVLHQTMWPMRTTRFNSYSFIHMCNTHRNIYVGKNWGITCNAIPSLTHTVFIQVNKFRSIYSLLRKITLLHKILLLMKKK